MMAANPQYCPAIMVADRGWPVARLATVVARPRVNVPNDCAQESASGRLACMAFKVRFTEAQAELTEYQTGDVYNFLEGGGL